MNQIIMFIGSLQNYARKYKYPIDTVAFNFKIVKENWHKIDRKPSDGIYIRGLFLEGARWDSTTDSLNDSLPKQLFTEIPVLHLDPQKNRMDPTQGDYHRNYAINIFIIKHIYASIQTIQFHHQ